MTLVIMAAGMGSRFGGLKQIEPINDNGEFIIDYSIYDAIRCGFKKVVFIIKEENYNIFRETVGKRIEDKIEVKYVFQNNLNVPKNIKLPEDRTKPLGTAHAILCCKDVVNEPFVVINSDDFYGYDAFKTIKEYLDSNTDESKYAMVTYLVGNTLTKYGAVKRGVAYSQNGKLSKLVESSISREEDGLLATPLDGEAPFKVTNDTLVSMNFFAFYPNIFDYLEKRFPLFLEENKNNLDKCEYLIPNVVFEMIEKGMISVEVLKTDAIWHGVTYREDKEELVEAIKELVKQKAYKTKLWD